MSGGKMKQCTRTVFAIMADAAVECGWTIPTQFALAMTYINDHARDGFLEFIDDIAKTELEGDDE